MKGQLAVNSNLKLATTSDWRDQTFLQQPFLIMFIHRISVQWNVFSLSRRFQACFQLHTTHLDPTQD